MQVKIRSIWNDSVLKVRRPRHVKPLRRRRSYSAHGKPRRQVELLDAMCELIVQDQLPIRPGRSEPAVWGATERNAELGIMFRYSRQP
jgi:hypothetical protein